MSSAWILLAVGGLVLALTALLNSARGAASAMPSARIVIQLPGYSREALLVLMAVVAMLMLVLAVTSGARRRVEEEFSVVRVVLGLLPALLVMALLLRNGASGNGEGGAGRWWFSRSGRESTDSADAPLVSLPVLDAAVAILALGVGLALVALLMWLVLGERIAAWWSPRPALAPSEPLMEAVDDSLDDLAAEPDARRAIIKCYRHFERALARADAPRAPWQTPWEHVRTALRRHPLPNEAVERLTDLFEICRFSHHPVGPRERELAWQSLAVIKQALEQREAGAPSA